MKITYDKTVDALKIKLNNKPCEKSLEVGEGVIIDFDVHGEVIAIEILRASTREINPYELVCRYHPELTLTEG
jgi:uncharacterized protein YuzE